MASLLAGTFFSAVVNCCELGFFLSRGHFGVGRFLSGISLYFLIICIETLF